MESSHQNCVSGFGDKRAVSSHKSYLTMQEEGKIESKDLEFMVNEVEGNRGHGVKVALRTGGQGHTTPFIFPFDFSELLY